MMRMALLAGGLLLLQVCLLAKDVKFPVSDIPASLKENVNVVVREDEMVFTIQSKDKATLYVHLAATILNSKGNRYAKEQLMYSKLRKINYLKGNVYDAQGNLVKKLKGSEILDQSIYDGTLFSDNRLKKADLSQTTYPYTVEFEYEIEYRYLYHINGTYLVSGKDVSSQHVSYKLIYPTALAPRYKLFNIDKGPVKTDLGNGVESLAWSFENIKPVTLEPLGPEPAEMMPHIMAAPSTFAFEGYEGSMDSWDSYGKWIALLNRDRGDLSPAARQKVKELTAHLATPEEKVKALYHYLQGKTRYVNITLGIGGLQPFPASVVDETGYGDCKALSNYMVAMLREAGIKAHYAVIMAGERAPEVILDFPSHQANHAIVAVPNGRDTLWLECTSQSNPFGYMGSFTGDRKALLITEDGGKLVNTIRYPAETNVQSRTAEVHMDLAGNAKAKVTTHYAGLEYETDDLHGILNDQYDEQRKWVLRNTGIPSFDVSTFSFKENKDKIPSAAVTLDLDLRRLASGSGKRLFITPNLMNRSTFIPEEVNERRSDVVLAYGYVHYDTIVYNLPEEIYPEFLPDPVTITSRFGEYQADFKVDQGRVVYIRKMKVYNGRFPPESYKELSDFYRGVNKADNVKLVFLNKT